MSELVSPTEFVDEAAQRARLLCSKFVVPLFEGVNPGIPRFVGSAVAFRTASQAFLLTAAHVLVRCDWRPFLLAAGMERRPVRNAGVALSTGKSAPGSETDSVDVAAIPLDEDEAKALRAEFLLPRQSAPLESEAAASQYIAIGYPDKLQERDDRNEKYQVRQMYISTSSAMQEKYDELRLGRGTHLLLNADRKSVRGPHSSGSHPSLVGMSGGGVWRVNPLECYSDDHLPSCVGLIIQKARRNEKLIHVTRMSLVNYLLNAAFPLHCDGIREAPMADLSLDLHFDPERTKHA